MIVSNKFNTLNRRSGDKNGKRPKGYADREPGLLETGRKQTVKWTAEGMAKAYASSRNVWAYVS